MKEKNFSKFDTEKPLKNSATKLKRYFGQMAGQIHLPDEFFDEDQEITALFNDEHHSGDSR